MDTVGRRLGQEGGATDTRPGRPKIQGLKRSVFSVPPSWASLGYGILAGSRAQLTPGLLPKKSVSLARPKAPGLETQVKFRRAECIRDKKLTRGCGKLKAKYRARFFFSVSGNDPVQGHVFTKKGPQTSFICEIRFGSELPLEVELGVLPPGWGWEPTAGLDGIGCSFKPCDPAVIGWRV